MGRSLKLSLAGTHMVRTKNDVITPSTASFYKRHVDDLCSLY